MTSSCDVVVIYVQYSTRYLAVVEPQCLLRQADTAWSPGSALARTAAHLAGRLWYGSVAETLVTMSSTDTGPPSSSREVLIRWIQSASLCMTPNVSQRMSVGIVETACYLMHVSLALEGNSKVSGNMTHIRRLSWNFYHVYGVSRCTMTRKGLQRSIEEISAGMACYSSSAIIHVCARITTFSNLVDRAKHYTSDIDTEL